MRLQIGPEDDEEELKDAVMADMADIFSKVDKGGEGVCVQVGGGVAQGKRGYSGMAVECWVLPTCSSRWRGCTVMRSVLSRLV
jgi:hypothetical protein